MFKRILALALTLTLSSCAAISEKVVEIAGNDLQRTSEIAEKYGKPEVKACSDFLLGSLRSEDSALAQMDALLKEETKGLASAALKAAILADLVASLRDGAARAKFESDFQKNCNAVAGAIMMNILRDARTVGSRGMSR